MELRHKLMDAVCSESHINGLQRLWECGLACAPGHLREVLETMVAPTVRDEGFTFQTSLTPMTIEFSLHRLRREGFIEVSTETHGVTSYRLLYRVDPDHPDQVVLQPRKVAKSVPDDGEDVPGIFC
jgi:hypothetical protein